MPDWSAILSDAPLDLSSLAILVSHDRSGSHFLGSFIKALPGNRMVDEVCNEDALDPATNPMSFLGYRHNRALEVPDYGRRRNPKVVSQLLDEYFRFVAEQFPGENVTVDIKYGHVHNFEAAWWPIFRRPFLFEYARRNKIRIVHLSRWNTLETVISSLVAESRKLWHAIGDKPQAQASEAVTVDTRQLLEQIETLNEQKAAFFRWTRGLKCLPVIYEELVNHDTGHETRQRVAQFLDSAAPAGFQSPYRKVTPSMQVIVRNWDEVKKFCRDNELAHYLLPITASSESPEAAADPPKTAEPKVAEPEAHES
jgi:hypothetical protein